MMGLLRRFEKSLEKAFEGPFAKVFKGDVHPLEIARRVLREMDDARVLGVNGVQAPDRFAVLLSPGDYEHLSGILDSLIAELESLAIGYANQKHYRLSTRPRLAVLREERLGRGEFEVQASFGEGSRERRGEEPPAGDTLPKREEAPSGALVVLSGVTAGSRHALVKPMVRIGRAGENDVVLPDLGVSRFHAEIERIREGYVLRDLGSTNGTLVGGRRVRERLLEDGDVLECGDVEMRFELVNKADEARG